MKTLLKTLFGIVVVSFGLMLGIGLIAKAMLSGSRIQTLVSAAESYVPGPVRASGGGFDLGQWFLLRPAVTIDDLSIGKPPLLQSKRVSAQASLLSLFSDRPNIRSMTLHEPILHIERDRGGRSNLDVLLEASARGGAKKAEGAVLSIDSLRIESGVIEYLEQGRPSLAVRDLDLSLTDFGADRTCNIALQARLFGSANSRLDFSGRAGPFQPGATPVEGNLAVALAPAEIPPAVRQEYFGDLMGDPGDSSRIRLEAAMKGDLARDLAGSGRIRLESLQVGRDKASRIPLSGDAPMTIRVRRPLADPALDLEIDNAALGLGGGRWKGRAELHFAGSQLRGSVGGAISGVQIDEMLAAFASTKGKLSGVAEIPEFRVSFAGRDAVSLQNSLSGQGVVTLDKGRIAIFDLLNTIERYSKRLLTGEAPAEGETAFTRFRSNFQIADRQLRLTGVELEAPAVPTTGQGFVTFSQDLNFDLMTTLNGRPVPVRVRGTIDAPKVYPDVGRLAGEEIKKKATGLLDRLLKGKSPEK